MAYPENIDFQCRVAGEKALYADEFVTKSQLVDANGDPFNVDANGDIIIPGGGSGSGGGTVKKSAAKKMLKLTAV